MLIYSDMYFKLLFNVLILSFCRLPYNDLHTHGVLLFLQRTHVVAAALYQSQVDLSAELTSPYSQLGNTPVTDKPIPL